MQDSLYGFTKAFPIGTRSRKGFTKKASGFPNSDSIGIPSGDLLRHSLQQIPYDDLLRHSLQGFPAGIYIWIY